MFGSEFPFGTPPSELRKVCSLGLESAGEAAVADGNFLHAEFTTAVLLPKAFPECNVRRPYLEVILQ